MPLSYKSLKTGAVLALASCSVADADPAAFDLAGPTVEVEVSHGGTTLPASQVPSLRAGDRVWMKADLPPGQSAHYLLVAAFLRGSTNPPPASAFFRCDTWDGKCSQQGMTVTVPKDAQQLLVFFAPETGGDYKTLLDAVRGRPGAFVRTSQDLNQATLDRSRLEAYLTAIRRLADTDPASLKESAPLLARSLAIKVDEKCLDKIPVLQAPCLMQGRESLILSDGHSTSMAQELTSGPASDLAMQASSTPQLHSGYYGPLVGSLLDIARILDSFHTAQYQYIPALASGSGRRLDLMLNAAPSFHDPKSVLVVALPAVEAPQFPPLHPVDATQIHCTTRDSLVLPVDGAPLMFSTDYAHNMALRLPKKDGTSIDLPARADPARGGFAVDTKDLSGAGVEDSVVGSLHGYWGFDKYDGPSFKLVSTHEQKWNLASGDEAALIVGREDTVHLLAGSVSCIEQIALSDAAGKEIKVAWKNVKPDQVEIRLPLQGVSPGDMTLLIRQYGEKQARALRLRAFSEAAHVDTFALHVGDSEGTLQGTRLDEVQSVAVNGVEFVPGALSSSAGRDELIMLARKGDDVSALKQADAAKAAVVLKDGRAFEVEVSVAAPRPSATLIDKNAQLSSAARDGSVQLSSQDELPQDARLTFSLRATSPPSFAHDDKVEVATADGSSSTLLGVGSGEMTLESVKVAVATLIPAKALGLSAFGPLRFRRVSNGVPGDWRPLATLVRLPVLKGLDCPPAAPGATCELSGANLFLLDSLSDDPQFTRPTKVPDGFTGQMLPVQRPTAGRLYVKLRDDPSVISTVAIEPPPASARGPEDGHPAAAPTQDLQGPKPSSQPPVPSNSQSPTGTAAPKATDGTVNQAPQAPVSPNST